MNTLLPFMLCLGLTVLLEGAVVLLWFRRWDYVYFSLLCNLLTNPALNLLLALLVGNCGLPYGGTVAVLEVLAVLVEARVYRMLCPFTRGQALAVSLVCNAVSFGAGLLLW